MSTKDLTLNSDKYYGNITELIQGSTNNKIIIQSGSYLDKTIELELSDVDGYLTNKDGFIIGKAKIGNKEHNVTLLETAQLVKSGKIESIADSAEIDIESNNGKINIINNNEINVAGSGKTTFSDQNGSVENLGTINSYSGSGTITTMSATSTVSNHTGTTEITENSGNISINENTKSIVIKNNNGNVAISETSSGSLIIEKWNIYVNASGELLFTPQTEV